MQEYARLGAVLDMTMNPIWSSDSGATRVCEFSWHTSGYDVGIHTLAARI